MTTKRSSKNNSIPVSLIAPCGMNCRLCRAYVRERNACPGCRSDDGFKSKACISCPIKNCEKLADNKIQYCSGCEEFPCTRLVRLDKRYRTRYGMSMIENLEQIRKYGIRHFISKEKKRRACPECGTIICVHKPQCLSCQYKWRYKSSWD